MVLVEEASAGFGDISFVVANVLTAFISLESLFIDIACLVAFDPILLIFDFSEFYKISSFLIVAFSFYSRFSNLPFCSAFSEISSSAAFSSFDAFWASSALF